ncbi:hypothetical protein GE061_006918 [Apolygus lucorum]|uniref:Uncharacterized protein n=1 Tax=Apolygus lucorum TaxID=248454 RepID=A0A8S9WU26_APOLU|nr:hypothetical protein GE061_006918 [Apolygus lucorum]
MVPKPTKKTPKSYRYDDDEDHDHRTIGTAPAKPDSNCKPPKPLLISEDGMGNSWKKWLQQWKWYATASCLSTRPPEIQIASFMSAIGPDVIDIFNSFSLDDEESENLDVIIISLSYAESLPPFREGSNNNNKSKMLTLSSWFPNPV